MSNDFEFDPAALDPSSEPEAAAPVVEEAAGKGKGKGKAKKAKKTKEPKAAKTPKASKGAKTPKQKKKREKVAAASGPKVKQFNIYTTMLLLTLLCLTVASLLLYLELSRYGDFPWWKTTGA